MNWSDERYVRLYTRDTVTWKRWRWETRAVLGLLIRKVDRAGVLDTGRTGKVEAFALLLEIPVAVAEPAIAEMLSAGTLVESDTGYLLPTFIEAQEAPQSDAARQRESREKRRAASMRNAEDACHTLSHAVTPSHTVSQPVTPTVPSVPSVPSSKGGDGRHQPLIETLTATFAAVRGSKYPFTPRDAKAVKALLALAEPDAIDAAWRKALRHQGYPTVSTLFELEKHLARFLGSTGPPGVGAFTKTSISEGL